MACADPGCRRVGDDQAPRNSAIALVLLGIAILISGIADHVSFMRGLRQERQEMKDAGLAPRRAGLPVSPTLIVALLLLLIGFVVIVDMTFGVSLFGGG